ncbi:MAG: ATP-grasp domain-containing protein [Bacteroides sp.]|nr:ATP-grasp domain-containing protein [Bacteroides sp.]
MKKNILVFPCGSEIGLDIYSSIEYSTHFNLIGGSSVEDHGMFVYDNYIDNIPNISSYDFINALKDIVKKYSIDAIYPTMDSVIERIKLHEEELGCRVISSPYDTTKICLSKRLTYDILTGIVRVPHVYEIKEITKFPVFVKPNVGYGSRGAKVINSGLEFGQLSTEEDYVICEYLPGEEYTVDCFSDFEGNLLYVNARKRNRIKFGISVNTSFEKDQREFQEFATKINSHLKFTGAWFFQVKRDINEQLCLLEIAARLGGSSLLSRAIGVNLALLSVFTAFGMNVSICKNSYNVVLDRALNAKYISDIKYDKVYVDFDDCLIIDKSKVNTKLIAFLYKCRNENVKVILLTKHDGDLNSKLSKFALTPIFDNIIHIPPTENKVEKISGNAIFIDDSFAEREAVKNKLGIPVFSPDMIDVLM